MALYPHNPTPSTPMPSIQREVHPLLERLDPLHFGLDPEDHVELDKLTPWETRGQGLAFPSSRGSSPMPGCAAEYWNMVTAQWMANQPSLLQADEMYALHSQVSPDAFERRASLFKVSTSLPFRQLFLCVQHNLKILVSGHSVHI